MQSCWITKPWWEFFPYAWCMWNRICCRPLSSKKIGTIWRTPLNVAMTTPLLLIDFCLHQNKHSRTWELSLLKRSQDWLYQPVPICPVASWYELLPLFVLVQNLSLSTGKWTTPRIWRCKTCSMPSTSHSDANFSGTSRTLDVTEPIATLWILVGLLVSYHIYVVYFTLPETNKAPENRPPLLKGK